jgi:type II secretory ATPase GspE/PulE/Tfp pilus assembly ATPase PilB-like protein
MPNLDQNAPPNSINEWVIALFDELHDPQVLEVVLEPGVRDAIVLCRGAAGTLRQRSLPSHLVAGVLAKMKKLAGLDVAERRHMQCGKVRLLDFHGSSAEFEVATRSAGDGETLTLRRL